MTSLERRRFHHLQCSDQGARPARLVAGGADRTKAGVRRFMFRIGKDNLALKELRGGELVMMGNRKMPGFYFVNEARCSDSNFKAWLEAALSNARTLPPK